jgi:hypothetical protein
MSIRAYAKHRSVTPAAVRKAIKTGRISTTNGKIDPAVADIQWRSNTDESKPRNSVTGDPGGQLGRSAAPVSPTYRPGSSSLPRTNGYAAARAVRETYEAKIRELDYKVRTGELVRADKARIAFSNAARRVRDLLLAIPERLGPVVAGLTDESEIHRVLSEEIRRACEELSEIYTTKFRDDLDSD